MLQSFTKGTAPDMPNIQKILTKIELRFVHQTGPDESSGEIDNFPAWNCVPRLFGVLPNR